MGDSESFNIGSGGTFRDFSFGFHYPNAGSFTPNFSVSVSYSENYTYSYTTYSWQQMGLSYCGWFDLCPIYGWVPHTTSGTGTDFTSGEANGGSPLIVDPVAGTPLPSAWGLLLSGLVAWD